MSVGKIGPKGDVVGRSPVRGLDLLEIVRGDADPAFRADDGAGLLDAEIRLTDVHAAGAYEMGDVRAIVHDEAKRLRRILDRARPRWRAKFRANFK